MKTALYYKRHAHDNVAVHKRVEIIDLSPSGVMVKPPEEDKDIPGYDNPTRIFIPMHLVEKIHYFDEEEPA
jgi:hypothetical protein